MPTLVDTSLRVNCVLDTRIEPTQSKADVSSVPMIGIQHKKSVSRDDMQSKSSLSREDIQNKTSVSSNEIRIVTRRD